MTATADPLDELRADTVVSLHPRHRDRMEVAPELLRRARRSRGTG